jgi:hypothetical protein
MAGAWTTLSVKDAGGTSRTMRVWDESGSGSGPFSFGTMLAVGDGSHAATFGAGAADAGTLRITHDTNQIGALQTADFVKSAGVVPSGLPTDQKLPNTLQSQTNGSTSSRVNAANSTNATNLKGSAGALINIDVFNVAAYSVFLKIYNKASAPTVGSDTPVWTIPIAAGTGFARSFPVGKWLGTGVSYAITKLQGDSDTTVVAAGDLTGSIDWI